MSQGRLNRLHERAPLKTPVFFESDGYVLKGFCSNISEGGLLIEKVSLLPEKTSFNLLLKVQSFASFANLGISKLRMLSAHNIDSHILNLDVSIVRSFEGESSVDKVFLKSIGLKLLNIDDYSKKVIKKYIHNTSENLVYLLGLFEKGTNESLIRQLAHYLGYPKLKELSSLRQAILHDYQSLILDKA